MLNPLLQQNSNMEYIESEFNNGLDITNDENLSNKEAISEPFTIESTSFEVENSPFTDDESSEYFENPSIEESNEYREMAEIDDDKTTTESTLDDTTLHHELLFSQFFESKVTKLFTKIRKVKKSRPITKSTTPLMVQHEDIMNEF